MALTIFEAMQSGAFQGPACWFTPNVPLTRTPSGKAYRCDTGEHRYHRDDHAASFCAFHALPMSAIANSALSQVWSDEPLRITALGQDEVTA